MASTPLGLIAYRCATAALAPVVPLFLRRRADRGKEDRSRMAERLGRAGIARPDGQLIWIHGASVGECLAALPLIDRLLEVPDRHVLLTSGTVTSAKLMAERLPPRAIHQFAPLDVPAPARRFLDHWRPDIGLFVDSEIWPNILQIAHGRGIPLALINGRMTAKSFAGWRRAPKTARAILSRYDLVLAQDKETAERLAALGADRVEVTGSLKADALPLPADAGKLAALERAIGSRPVWLAASTHPGEDETVLPAHDALRQDFPDLLTIIVPRHPERGAEIAMLCGARKNLRRATGANPMADTAIYIGDTMGELGLFYRVARCAFVGGSLVPHGGQNPLEAARLACPILIGPHTFNFTGATAAILAAQGGGLVHNCAEIVAMAKRPLSDPAEAERMGKGAAAAATALGGAVEKTRARVEALLDKSLTDAVA